MKHLRFDLPKRAEEKKEKEENSGQYIVVVAWPVRAKRAVKHGKLWPNDANCRQTVQTHEAKRSKQANFKQAVLQILCRKGLPTADNGEDWAST